MDTTKVVLVPASRVSEYHVWESPCCGSKSRKLLPDWYLIGEPVQHCRRCKLPYRLKVGGTSE